MDERTKREERTQQELLAELNKMNRAQARIKRRTTFLLSVIALLVLVTGTLAWFTLNTFASVDNIQMNIITAPDLRVDTENHGSDVELYQKTVTGEMIDSWLTSNNYKKMSDQLLDPVTSSAGITFTNRNGTTRKENDDSYLEFKLWFIATKDMWVHLSSESAEALNGATTSVTTTESGSKADIVRAVRLSFEDSGSTAIFEPNAGSAVAGQTTFDLPSPMSYSNATRLFHLNELEPKQITIRLWAEGEDPECDNDVQDADIAIDLLFSGTDENNAPF